MPSVSPINVILPLDDKENLRPDALDFIPLASSQLPCADKTLAGQANSGNATHNNEEQSTSDGFTQEQNKQRSTTGHQEQKVAQDSKTQLQQQSQLTELSKFLMKKIDVTQTLGVQRQSRIILCLEDHLQKFYS